MAMTIKIECECGQRYAFDVEPVRGCMPSPVACPACGVDGTTAANGIIAARMTPRPVAAAAGGGGSFARAELGSCSVGVATAAPAAPTVPRRTGAGRPGQLDRTQAEREARSKVLWGDPPEQVMQYLVSQGVLREEASEMVTAMVLERAAIIRGTGIRKIATGAALASVPVIAYFVFARIGVLPVKLFAMTVMVGLWGAWMLFNGTFMLLTPKSEPGDVADQ